MAHLDLAVRAETDDGPGDLLEAVAEAAVLEAEPQPDGAAGRDGAVVLGADLVQAAFGP